MEYRNDGTIYEIEEVGSLLSDVNLCGLSAKIHPLGLFYKNISNEDEDEYGFSKECFLGIDNSTGEAWKKFFSTREECKRWLREGQICDDKGRQERKRAMKPCEHMTRNEKYLRIRDLLEMETLGCNFHELSLPEKTKQYIDGTCIYEWHMARKSVFMFLTGYGRFRRDIYQDKVIDMLFNGRASECCNISDYDGEKITTYINRSMRAVLYWRWKKEYAVLEIYRSDEDLEAKMQELYLSQEEGKAVEFFKLPGLFPLLRTL